MSGTPVLLSSLRPFIGLAPGSPCLPCTGSPAPATVLQMSHQCGAEGQAYLPRHAGNPRSNAVRFAAFAVRARCWLTVNFGSTRNLRAFSAELLSSQLASSLSCPGLFLPRGRSLHFPLLDILRFLLAHCSSPPRSLWKAAQLSGVTNPTSAFCIICPLAEGALSCIIQVMNKDAWLLHCKKSLGRRGLDLELQFQNSAQNWSAVLLKNAKMWSISWIGLQSRVWKLQYWSQIRCISILDALGYVYKLFWGRKRKISDLGLLKAYFMY